MYLSIRDDIVELAGYATIAEGLRDLDIPGIELFVRRDDTVPAIAPRHADERLNLTHSADLAHLQNQASQSGARISALCMANNFNAPDRTGEIAWAVRTVEAARMLGVPVVRVDSIMHGEKELPLETRQDIVARALHDILAETSRTGVDLGIENHGHQGNDPEFLEGLLSRVDSERVGLTLDSGNFYWRGWPLSRIYEIFSQFASRVKHTHIKNIQYPAEMRETLRPVGFEYGKYVSPIAEGDIDHTRYIAILKQAGYDRDICLEDESLGRFSPEERKANLRAAADLFRPLM